MDDEAAALVVAPPAQSPEQAPEQPPEPMQVEGGASSELSLAAAAPPSAQEQQSVYSIPLGDQTDLPKTTDLFLVPLDQCDKTGRSIPNMWSSGHLFTVEMEGGVSHLNPAAKAHVCMYTRLAYLTLYEEEAPTCKSALQVRLVSELDAGREVTDFIELEIRRCFDVQFDQTRERVLQDLQTCRSKFSPPTSSEPSACTRPLHAIVPAVAADSAARGDDAKKTVESLVENFSAMLQIATNSGGLRKRNLAVADGANEGNTADIQQQASVLFHRLQELRVAPCTTHVCDIGPMRHIASQLADAVGLPRTLNLEMCSNIPTLSMLSLAVAAGSAKFGKCCIYFLAMPSLETARKVANDVSPIWAACRLLGTDAAAGEPRTTSLRRAAQLLPTARAPPAGEAIIVLALLAETRNGQDACTDHPTAPLMIASSGHSNAGALHRSDSARRGKKTRWCVILSDDEDDATVRVAAPAVASTH